MMPTAQSYFPMPRRRISRLSLYPPPYRRTLNDKPQKNFLGAIALAQPLHIQASLVGLRQLMQAAFDVRHAACGP